jgi:mono/diheme cytochrome c family protein
MTRRMPWKLREGRDCVGEGARLNCRRPLTTAFLLILALMMSGCRQQDADTSHLADLDVPLEHLPGRDLFESYCSACHGPQARGTELGPPLVHAVYRPRHHGDESFQLAVVQGVRAHHFRFGDMPAVAGLSRDDIAAITGYVRWLQRSAGID